MVFVASFAIFQNCHPTNNSGIFIHAIPHPSSSILGIGGGQSFSTLPAGASTLTAPATDQYDSGDITVTTPNANACIMAVDGTHFAVNPQFCGGSSVWDGRNIPQIQGYEFRGQQLWASTTKLKFYTNLSSTGLPSPTSGSDPIFVVVGGGARNFYDINNGTLLGGGWSWGGTWSGWGHCDQTVPGATLSTGSLAQNVGDPGTCFGEISLIGSHSLNFNSSHVGVKEQGQSMQQVYNSQPAFNVDVADTTYIGLVFHPRMQISGLKFRYFIEHN